MVLLGCNSYVDTTYQRLYDSKFDLPWLNDSTDYTVFMYVDSSGCNECKMSLSKQNLSSITIKDLKQLSVNLSFFKIITYKLQ